MLNYIEKLQKKPEHIRRRILYIVVIIFMFIIITIWESTFSLRTSAQNVSVKNKIEARSPTSVLVDGGKTFYADFMKGIDKIKSPSF